MKKKSKAGKIIKITLLSFLGVLVAAIAAAAFILCGRIATMASVKHVGSDLYTMNFQQDCDDNIRTEWSIVYHLTDFAMDISVDMDFDNVYHLEISDF